MPVTYDPSGHELLSNEANALGPAELEKRAILAERVLGIHGTGFTGDDAEALTMAVALQVNLHLDRPREALWAQSESRSGQSVEYRAVSELEIDGKASRLVQGVTGRKPGQVRPPSASGRATYRFGSGP